MKYIYIDVDIRNNQVSEELVELTTWFFLLIMPLRVAKIDVKVNEWNLNETKFIIKSKNNLFFLQVIRTYDLG
jgi:hypothetical protein